MNIHMEFIFSWYNIMINIELSPIDREFTERNPHMSKKQKDCSPIRKTSIGGQALMEGIMMQGSDRIATVIKNPHGGMRIRITPRKAASGWKKIPVLRGVMAFISSMVTGCSILMYSAEVLESFEEEGPKEEEKDKLTLFLEKHFGEKAALTVMLYMSVVLAIGFTVGVFILLPTLIINFCKNFTESHLILNLLEGILRIVLFVGYVAVISRMEEIRRVFQYHGAEHKTIHCYENGLELTPENAQSFETLHPRCGTSFMVFVMIISLLLFSLLGWPNLVMRVLSRLLLLPVIAGISYEVLQWAGRSDSAIVKVLSLPGILLQKLTTRCPDTEQLEVAITAMKACITDQWNHEDLIIADIADDGTVNRRPDLEAAEKEKQ